MTSLPLEYRVAVVTGASAGIGAAIARDLVACGAKVVINARRLDKLEALVSELGRSRAIAVAGDCSRPEVIQRMLDAARDGHGGGVREADLVVVNAGRGLGGSVMNSDVTKWQELISTNYVAAALLIREAGNRMLKAVAGRSGPGVVDAPRDIVVIGSVVGKHVSPFSSMYGSTKFALHGLTEGVRRELGPKGIRVSMVAPGFVESEFQSVAGYDPAWFNEVSQRIGPVLSANDVAKTVSFVAQQPPAVHLAEIFLRPTRQDYP